MHYFYDSEKDNYISREDDCDFEKIPIPLNAVQCEKRPDFAIWKEGAWLVDNEAKSKDELKKQLAEIDLKKSIELRKNNFDNEAQAFRYGDKKTEWADFSKWLDDMNDLWDDVKNLRKKFENVDDLHIAMPVVPTTPLIK